MSKNWTHWCPTGCGKCVYYGYSESHRVKPRFICPRCNRSWANKKIFQRSQIRGKVA